MIEDFSKHLFTHLPSYLLVSLLGFVLGMVFFVGLWWTLHKGLRGKHPGIYLLGSFLLRMGLTLAGFYWIAGNQWQRLLACLLGFLLARTLALRYLPQMTDAAGEAGHVA